MDYDSHFMMDYDSFHHQACINFIRDGIFWTILAPILKLFRDRKNAIVSEEKPIIFFFNYNINDVYGWKNSQSC